MASDNETVSEIVKEMRDEWAQCYFSEGVKRKDGEYSEFPAIDTNEVADRVDAAHKREVDSLNFKLMTAKSEQKTAANVIIEQTNKIENLEREVAELTNIIHAECNHCGDCAMFGKDCNAGDVDGSEDNRACEKFVSREVAELRECLKEMIADKVGRCHSRWPCKMCGNDNCKVKRWRKALEGAGNEKE